MEVTPNGPRKDHGKKGGKGSIKNPSRWPHLKDIEVGCRIGAVAAAQTWGGEEPRREERPVSYSTRAEDYPTTSDDEFFDRPREWSRYKHEILGNYLFIWVSKLASRNDELAFVDTCAGEGRYDDGSDGSPLIAARLNDHAILRGRARLLVHACESRKEVASKLVTALEPWTSREPPCAVIYRTRFEKVLPQLIVQTRGTPTLFFIDPYGHQGLTIEELKPILDEDKKKRAPTEILARVDPGLFARFAGWRRTKERTEKGTKTAESFRRLLDKFVDVSNLPDDVDLEDPESRQEGIVGMMLFEEYLKSFDARFGYVQIIPIRPDYFAKPKYYLVHATDSPDGAAKINDTVSTTEDTLFATTLERRAPGQTDMFGAHREPRVTIESAKTHVLKVLSDGQEHPFVNVCADLAIEFGPDLREKHHRKAIQQLISEGTVRRAGEGAFKRNTAIWLTAGSKKLGRR